MSREEEPAPANIHPRHRAREALVQALYQWHYNPIDPRDLEMEFLDAGYLDGAERAYFQQLIRKAVERHAEIDALIAPAVMPRRLTELTGVELAILRLAVCELLERSDIPYRVVINEAVELAKSFGTEQGYRFVNAVVDRIAREQRAGDPEAGPHADG
jgi:N utilization substance protein B